MNLDEMVLRVHPGSGVIARFGGAVLAIMAPDAAQDPMVDEILRVVEECVGRASLPGRSVSRQLAALISQAEPEEVPSFAALAQVEGGLAILLHGSIEATVSGPAGGERLSGRQAASWVDRIIETSVDRVVVGSPGDGTAVPDERTSLLGGVVPGGGLSLVVAGAAVDADAGATLLVGDEAADPPAEVLQSVASDLLPPAIAAPDSGAADFGAADFGAADFGAADFGAAEESDQAEPGELQEPGELPEPEVDEPAAAAASEPSAEAVPDVDGPEAPAESEVPAEDMPVSTSDEPEEPPEPISPGRTTAKPHAMTAVPEPDPVEPDEPAAVPDAPDDRNQADGPVIKGVICARGHFGNPSAGLCAVCGTSMDHRTLNLVDGNRPPLGVLVFDDGTTCTLDGDCVLGREPDRDEAVVSGRARPLLVTDDDLEISRIHAGVVLDGWDVTIVDLDSANGTFMSNPDGSWTRLIPQVPVVMSGGMRVRLGQRTVLFDTPGSR